MTVVFLAETSSVRRDEAVSVIVPRVLTVARTASSTSAQVKSPETARPNAPWG